jgi:YD repeat-containing protein
MSLDALLGEGKLERVAASDQDARVTVAEARRHVESAELITTSDPNGAFQLAYDAARKSVSARMQRDGVRVRRGVGSHAITASFARAVISDELGKRFDAMRRQRNRSEYGRAFFSADAVEHAIAVARELIAIVEG